MSSGITHVRGMARGGGNVGMDFTRGGLMTYDNTCNYED